MSSKYIKSGLELFEEDFADGSQPKKKKVETTVTKKKKSKGPKTKAQQNVKPIYERKVQNILKAQERKARNDIDENIKALKRVDRKIGASEHFLKVAEIQEQSIRKKVLKPKKEEKSVFTEEDFKTFGEECSSVL